MFTTLSHFYEFFFFSSRRRHTRCSRDWSSDVCSSDLCDSTRRPGARRSRHSSPKTTWCAWRSRRWRPCWGERSPCIPMRSEEHTSELQSRLHLVCRLLLEKKKQCR